MSNVNHIKQKAIEIANNSLQRIISGVMNQKESIADCFSDDDCFEAFTSFGDDDYCVPIKQSLVSRIARDERRAERKQIRLQRRLNGY